MKRNLRTGSSWARSLPGAPSDRNGGHAKRSDANAIIAHTATKIRRDVTRVAISHRSDARLRDAQVTLKIQLRSANVQERMSIQRRWNSTTDFAHWGCFVEVAKELTRAVSGR